MRRAVVVVLLLTAAAGVAHAAEPTEASLLEAWENGQRSDPKSVVFERIGNRTYRFETTRFPFKGELKVLSLNLEELELPGDDGAVMGVVEVELVGAGDDFIAKHAHSYGSWHGGNMLYFDRKADRWLSSREWQREIQKRLTSWSGLLSAGNVFFVALLLLLLVLLFRVSRKANRQFASAMALQQRALADQQESMAHMRRSLELSEDSNRLLREILDEFRSRRS